MIGNDIVDLELAKTQSNWQRKGFLTKIFTSQERQMIEQAKDPFRLVWLLWSMKESAYKCYVQKKKVRFFAPKKFQCELITNSKGLVLIDNEAYCTHSKLTNKFILTEANAVLNKRIENGYFELNYVSSEMTSSIIRHKIKKAISINMKLPVEKFSIKKNALGIPYVYRGTKQLQVSISMTHHGNFGAYSILNQEA